MRSPKLPNPLKGYLRLRPARTGDGKALGRIFYDAVHQGASARYSAAERAAWAPTAPADAAWEERLLSGSTIVACRPFRPVGFATLHRDGHLDFLYVRPDQMGRGTAQRLHGKVLDLGRSWGLALLTTDASYLARSFLEKNGWRTTARQSVIRNGTALTNFRMERELP